MVLEAQHLLNMGYCSIKEFNIEVVDCSYLRMAWQAIKLSHKPRNHSYMAIDVTEAHSFAFTADHRYCFVIVVLVRTKLEVQLFGCLVEVYRKASHQVCADHPPIF